MSSSMAPTSRPKDARSRASRSSTKPCAPSSTSTPPNKPPSSSTRRSGTASTRPSGTTSKPRSSPASCSPPRPAPSAEAMRSSCEIADQADAAVLSNDSFQEFHGQYTWLFDEGRLVGGKPVPGVGWVFLLRTPVRGPVSRRAVQEAERGQGASRRSSWGRGSQGDTRPPTKPAQGRTRRRSDGQDQRTDGQTTASDRRPLSRRAAADDGSGARKRARQPLEPLNEPLAVHRVRRQASGRFDRRRRGRTVLVARRVRHAAGARCYVPLKLMGDPAPKSHTTSFASVKPRDVHRVRARYAAARYRPRTCPPQVLLRKPTVDMPADQQEQATIDDEASTSRRGITLGDDATIARRHCERRRVTTCNARPRCIGESHHRRGSTPLQIHEQTNGPRRRR